MIVPRTLISGFTCGALISALFHDAMSKIGGQLVPNTRKYPENQVIAATRAT